MLRIAAVTGGALAKRHLLPSTTTSKSSTILSHGTHLPVPPITPSLCYRRMARRSPPPARRNANVNEESESEPGTDAEVENEMEFDPSDDDDGEESEEWEGFMMDFGALDKNNSDDPNNEGTS